MSFDWWCGEDVLWHCCYGFNLIVIDVYMRSRASVTSVSNVYALGMTLCGVFLRYGHSRGGIPYEPTYTR